jgi:hypothetical protein
LDDPVPDPGREHLPEEGGVLVGKTAATFILEISPHLVEALAMGVVNTFSLFGNRNEPGRQVDGEHLRRVAILTIRTEPSRQFVKSGV